MTKRPVCGSDMTAEVSQRKDVAENGHLETENDLMMVVGKVSSSQVPPERV